MEDEMYEDDADLIEQVSDDDAMDDEMHHNNNNANANHANNNIHPDADPDKNNNNNNNNNPDAQRPTRARGTRLSDQINMDDEPALQGYQRTDMIGQGAYGGTLIKTVVVLHMCLLQSLRHGRRRTTTNILLQLLIHLTCTLCF
jgi:hypothetical protein